MDKKTLMQSHLFYLEEDLYWRLSLNVFSQIENIGTTNNL